MKKSLSHDAFAATLAALGTVALAAPVAASPVQYKDVQLEEDDSKDKKKDEGDDKKKKKDGEGGCGSGSCS